MNDNHHSLFPLENGTYRRPGPDDRPARQQSSSALGVQPTGGPAVGDIDPSIQRINRDTRLPMDVLRLPDGPSHPGMRDCEDNEDFDLPFYRGALIATIIICLTDPKHYTILMPLEETRSDDLLSFKIFFKRATGSLCTQDMMVASESRYINDFWHRHSLLEIYFEAECLRRIWIIDPGLINGTVQFNRLPDDFMRNRPGLYLECECGAHVYVDQIVDWVRHWTSHFAFCHYVPRRNV